MSNFDTFHKAGRVGSKIFNLAPGRVGSGQGPGGSGWVGSEKSDPRPTLSCIDAPHVLAVYKIHLGDVMSRKSQVAAKISFVSTFRLCPFDFVLQRPSKVERFCTIGKSVGGYPYPFQSSYCIGNET